MKKASKKFNERKSCVGSGLFISAGIFLGMGLGFIYSHLVAGLFIGLGAGFFLAGLFGLFRKR
jgi:uncharacterized membrane protein